MKTFLSITLVAVFWSFSSGGLAQEKLAQTGFQFLSVGTDARATAMGEAFTTLEGTSLALFYNPAGMVRLSSVLDLRINRMTWIADIEYFSGTMALNLFDSRFGVLGISFLYVDYGEILGTVVAENEAGYIETGTFNPSAYLIGVGYAKDLTDRFSIGGQVKYVVQSLGKPYVPISLTEQERKEFRQSVFAFDFGTLYKTGFKSLAFGMTLKNFSRELKYVKEGFLLPLTFRVGFSMDVLDFVQNRPEAHRLFLSIDAINPRSHQEFVAIGGEYRFLDRFVLRGGYVTGQDGYSMTAGFGVNLYGLSVDFSYTPYKIFNDVNRFTFSFTF